MSPSLDFAFDVDAAYLSISTPCTCNRLLLNLDVNSVGHRTRSHAFRRTQATPSLVRAICGAASCGLAPARVIPDQSRHAPCTPPAASVQAVLDLYLEAAMHMLKEVSPPLALRPLRQAFECDRKTYEKSRSHLRHTYIGSFVANAESFDSEKDLFTPFLLHHNGTIQASQ
ncbi:hypothetical protein DFH07DRAFT_957595 [Mycena maculata]|uniref:Uncharacterized protein n=1 Tax=Mycena maculata TaxID=230809 RepID=A0AAD7NGS9_9AGAR|nr:hypothetical protein DFH07DRAFT_957595 [Mycena maculata]